MTRSHRLSGGLVALLLALTSLTIANQASAAAGGPHQSGDSGPAVHHDTSAPLGSMTPAPASKTKVEQKDKRDQGLPHPAGAAPDPVVQSTAGTAAVPTAGTGFLGVGNGFSGPQGGFLVSSAPPDTNAAVGTSQIVEMVNSSFAVFDKTGKVLYGPAATNTVFSGFGGACESTDDGDGIVRHDALTDRWIISQLANVASSTGPYYECIAVSTSSNALGSYNRYVFQYTLFPDYPKVSVWPDSYYVTYNMFSGNSFAGAQVCALNKAAMLQGQAASQQCFTTSNSYGGLLAADVDDSVAPPTGADNVVVGLGATNTTLATWRFHTDWNVLANTTFTGPGSITVGGYSLACGGGTCIPQAGTTNQLDSLGDRLMTRLAYRNFGDHESLVVTHSVNTGSTVGVRWYELRLSNGAPSLYQQGTYAPDGTYRWMSSAAMDKVGNIGLGFSTSSSTTHPGIGYTARLAGDPLGQMTQGDGVFGTGSGSQTNRLHRWGDYSSIVVDPVDGCTFWNANEFIPSSGSFNWSTHIDSFTLPGCSSPAPPPPTNDFSISASPSSASVTQGASATSTVSTAVTSGSAQTVTLAASGLPTGATAAFNPTSLSSGGSSTLTITTATSTPTGTYAVTITGTGSSASHSTTFTLTVNASVVAQPPTATTGSATSIAATSVNLNGTVNPSGQATTWWFDLGTTSSYGWSSPMGNLAASNSDTGVIATVTGLSPSTTYHFRVCATNATGTTCGSDMTFTTPNTSHHGHH